MSISSRRVLHSINDDNPIYKSTSSSRITVVVVVVAIGVVADGVWGFSVTLTDTSNVWYGVAADISIDLYGHGDSVAYVSIQRTTQDFTTCCCVCGLGCDLRDATSCAVADAFIRAVGTDANFAA